MIREGGTHFLDEFTKSSNYYIRYTVTKAAKGGRGYYFRNLLTAEVPREIQRSFADVMKRLLTRSEEFDLGMLCKESYIFTNDFSTKLYDDEERFRRDEDFENTVEHAMIKASNIFAEPSTINWSSNIVDDDWSKHEFSKVPVDETGVRELPNAFEENDEGERVLAFNAVGVLKLLIEQYMRPQSCMFYVIVSMLHSLGISLNNSSGPPSIDSGSHFMDKVPMRLYLFACVYMGEVLFHYNSDSKDAVMLALESNSKVCFHRGNSLGSYGRSKKQNGYSVTFIIHDPLLFICTITTRQYNIYVDTLFFLCFYLLFLVFHL